MDTAVVSKNILSNREPFEIAESQTRKPQAVLQTGERLPFNGHTCRATVQLDEVNVIKYDDYLPRGIYKACDVRISFNDITVYGFRADTAETALALCISYIMHLRALPVDLSSRGAIEQKLIGRKVWLRSKPTIIDGFEGPTGTVVLLNDPSEGFSGNGLTRVDILSHEITWNRE